MRQLRRVLIVVLALVWALSAPLAMASDHCMSMGAMCEGPCGASTCAVSPPVTTTVSELTTAAPALATSHLPDVPAVVLELPPK